MDDQHDSDGSTDHAEPQDLNAASEEEKTTWGAVSLTCTLSGVVFIIIGSLMAVGMADPETPDEEGTFEGLMGVVRTFLVLGFIFQGVALAVGLAGVIVRWRLDRNDPDPHLAKAIGISGSVIAVGALILATAS